MVSITVGSKETNPVHFGLDGQIKSDK